jgi:N-acetylglutamate synthase-like GNAT family acetyltransferase
MAGAVDPCECLLAEDGDALAGLARIEYAAGTAYLRPIVVASAYRGHGVGRSLIDTLRARDDQIWVVARGNAAGFYESLGFQPMDWEMVEPAFQAECAECLDSGTCNPIAMRTQGA